jgi:GxxExxY protein
LGLKVERQKALPLVYKEIQLDQGYRIDLLVEEQVIVEPKVVEQFTPVHEAQVLSYLKFSGCQIGLLINFNVKLLKNGVRRFIMTKHR